MQLAETWNRRVPIPGPLAGRPASAGPAPGPSRGCPGNHGLPQLQEASGPAEQHQPLAPLPSPSPPLAPRRHRAQLLSSSCVLSARHASPPCPGTRCPAAIRAGPAAAAARCWAPRRLLGQPGARRAPACSRTVRRAALSERGRVHSAFGDGPGASRVR